MQRTFSGFPTGWIGVALLVLRVCVGASATIEAGFTIAGSHAAVSVTTVVAGCVVVVGLALSIGFLTPIASALLCLTVTAIMLMRVPSAVWLLFDSSMASFEFVVMSAVLVILGPGAISVDARLFGRREVAIRELRRPNDF